MLLSLNPNIHLGSETSTLKPNELKPLNQNHQPQMLSMADCKTHYQSKFPSPDQTSPVSSDNIDAIEAGPVCALCSAPKISFVSTECFYLRGSPQRHPVSQKEFIPLSHHSNYRRI